MMKRIWRCITPLFVYVIVNMITIFIATSACSFVTAGKYTKAEMIEITQDPALYQQYLLEVQELLNKNLLLITGIAFFIMIPVLLYMYRKDFKKMRVPQSNLPVYTWSLLPVLGVGLCLCLNGFISVTPLGDLLGSSYEDTAEAIYSASYLLQILSVGVLAPIAEELIFRGLMYKRMRVFLTAPLAIMISAVMFGIYHGNMLQFLYAMILGFFLAYAYEIFRSVIAPIIIHAAANLISVILTNNQKVNSFLAKDKETFLVTTIVCAIISLICIVILVLQNKKGEEKNE